MQDVKEKAVAHDRVCALHPRYAAEFPSKGIPVSAGTVRLGDVGKQGWNVLRGDMMLPLLTVRSTRMTKNLQPCETMRLTTACISRRMASRQSARKSILSRCRRGDAGASPRRPSSRLQSWQRLVIPILSSPTKSSSRANIEQLSRSCKAQYPNTAIYSLVDSPGTLDELRRYGAKKLAAASGSKC